MEEKSVLLTIMMAAGPSLFGAILMLFKMLLKNSKEQMDLAKRVGHLEGKQEGIIKLSEDVLQTVHNAIIESNQPKEGTNGIHSK